MTTKTENSIKQWNNEAGPRQSKQAVEAIQHILSRGKFHIELTGVEGIDEDSREVWAFGSETCDDALQRYNMVGEQFGWTITRKNYKQVIEAATEAAANIVLPIVDDRRSHDQERERIEANKRYEQERNEKAAKLRNEVEAIAAELRKQYPNAKPEGKLSGPARAAANLKAELQREFPGVKFSVTSDRFSMGNAVRIGWTDGPTCEQVRNISGKYQYYAGLSQDDCQQYDSSAYGKAVEQVLGRAKYVSESRDISPELRQAVIALLSVELFGTTKPAETMLDDHSGHTLKERASQIIWHSDVRGSRIRGFKPAESGPHWLLLDMEQPTVPTPEAGSGEAYRIVKQFHTKKQVEFFIAVPVDRLDRDVYLAELSRAKTFGGWKSRKWGSSPSGFGFETIENAEAFTIDSSQPETETGTAIDRPGDSTLADLFDDMAEGLESKIEDCFRPSTQNWTAKRGQQWDAKKREGGRLQRTQKALRELAAMHRAGEVPSALAGFQTKKSIYAVLALKTRPSDHSCYDHIETSEYHSTTPEAVALQQLIAESPEAQSAKLRENELRSKIDGCRRGKEPGFFPTPETLGRRMIEAAMIDPDHDCLEPSAGIGDLADLIAEKLESGSLTCVEQKFTYAEICELKGHETVRADFMEWAIENQSSQKFDRIIMNPPFERQQDAKHIAAACNLLKPGGILVALCAANALDRDTKASRELNWFYDSYGVSNRLIEGAFNGPDSFKKTGVSVRLLVFEKTPENPLAFSSDVEAEYFGDYSIESEEQLAQRGMFGQDFRPATDSKPAEPQPKEATAFFPELDMKKGDLPGQTTIFDSLARRDENGAFVNLKAVSPPIVCTCHPLSESVCKCSDRHEAVEAAIDAKYISAIRQRANLLLSESAEAERIDTDAILEFLNFCAGNQEGR